MARSTRKERKPIQLWSAKSRVASNELSTKPPSPTRILSLLVARVVGFCLSVLIAPEPSLQLCLSSTLSTAQNTRTTGGSVILSAAHHHSAAHRHQTDLNAFVNYSLLLTLIPHASCWSPLALLRLRLLSLSQPLRPPSSPLRSRPIRSTPA